VVENPRYATAIGLLKMAKEDLSHGESRWPDGNSVMDLFKKMKMWFQGNF